MIWVALILFLVGFVLFVVGAASDTSWLGIPGVVLILAAIIGALIAGGRAWSHHVAERKCAQWAEQANFDAELHTYTYFSWSCLVDIGDRRIDADRLRFNLNEDGELSVIVGDEDGD